jgi:hypothetical protein
MTATPAASATSSTPTPPAPSTSRGRRGLQLVVLVAFAVTLLFGISRAWDAVRTFQRLQANLEAPGRPDVASIQDWMPLSGIARRFDVPEALLVEVLRDAGFVVGSPEGGGVPDTVHQWLRPLRELLTGRGASVPRGDPDSRGDGLGGTGRQTLRQIARASGDDPARAVRVVREAIRRHWDSRASARNASPVSAGAGAGAGSGTAGGRDVVARAGAASPGISRL